MSRHLMAKMRRLADSQDDRRREFGFELDWTPDANMRNYKAKLENGDEIEVRGNGTGHEWQYQIRGPLRLVKEIPKHERQWGTYHGAQDDDGIPRARGIIAWEGANDYRDENGMPSVNGKRQAGWADPKDAIRAAESHYFGLRRRTQAPASGLEYEELVNPRQHLDDDFGDIFGDQS